MRRIGVLTSGGDSPGMNAAVVAVARTAAMYDMPLVGIKRGYNGLLRKQPRIEDDLIDMPLDLVLDIADLPGTYLRTARCDEFRDPFYQRKAIETLAEMNVVGLVVIGGDGSFQGAMRLCEQGVPCIGIPGTIDNDLAYTGMTLGYDTAVNICMEGVRAIRATSRSHDRTHVVEVMGRHCGDIALNTAIATGAEIVLVPEVKWSVEQVAERLQKLLKHGNYRNTIIVAEGCWESMKPFNHHQFLKDHGIDTWEKEPMNAKTLARVLRTMIPQCDARATVLGYTQRGGQPTARDAGFAFEAGYMAVNLLREGIGSQVIGRTRGKVFHMDMAEALACKRRFDKKMYELVNRL